ncbi:MAG: HPP family protein [Chloroflexi bacterium]|nr:HPP family protein [Chloroflexota bacterium]
MQFLTAKARHLPIYLRQSLAATGILFVLFSFEDLFVHAALFAAIGSTTFVLFAMPRSLTARPRRVIGGHVVGMVVGVLASAALASPLGDAVRPHAKFVTDIVASIAVGLAILAMALTDTQHPPAAGTALGIALHGWDLGVILFILTAAIGLSLTHHVLRRHLSDLF